MSQSPDPSGSGSESESRFVDPSKEAALPGVTPDETTADQPRGRSTYPRTLRAASSHSETGDITSQHVEAQEHPPVDARAMSPRRGSEETEALGEAARTAVREQARQLQLNLLEIAESIELVKADHDKLEKQNLALQDYIGGLTRSMSQGQAPKGSKGSSK